jgi:predicted enzyme related to lactoylglutathione lyase
MSSPEHEQIIRHGHAVAEAMDVPGFVNTFTPDGTFTDEAFGNVFTGPKELAIMLQVFGTAFPDMHRPASTLAIGSTSTMAMFGAGAARPADNHTVIIEFRVGDVDGEYRKLKTMISDVVQEPTTMPWGNRSLLFRDPDGNLINFFTPVSAEAIKKYGL